MEVVTASQPFGGPGETHAEVVLVRQFVFGETHILVNPKKGGTFQVIRFAERRFDSFEELFHVLLGSLVTAFVGLKPLAVVVVGQIGQELQGGVLNFHRSVLMVMENAKGNLSCH